jgi:hypothetical protein
MNVKEVGWGGMGWIDLAQDKDGWKALVTVGMKLLVPQNPGMQCSDVTYLHWYQKSDSVMFIILGIL